MRIPFKVGDAVGIRKDSSFYYQAPNIEGKVTHIKKSSSHLYIYYVTFKDETKNLYRKKDLERLPKVLSALRKLKS